MRKQILPFVYRVGYEVGLRMLEDELKCMWVFTKSIRYVSSVSTKGGRAQQIHAKFMNIKFHRILYAVLEVLCTYRWTDGDKGRSMLIGDS
jgi:hypothetical protein